MYFLQDLMAEVESVVEEVLTDEVLDIAKTGAQYVSTALRWVYSWPQMSKIYSSHKLKSEWQVALDLFAVLIPDSQ